MTYHFLGATPDHWCSVQPLIDANWTTEQIISLAIPTNNATGKYEECLMRDYDYRGAAALGYETTFVNLSEAVMDTQALIACPSRTFNYSQHAVTTVTEWDLVCDRRYLYSTTQTATFLGHFIGNLFSGHLYNVTGRRRGVLISRIVNIIFNFLAAAAPDVYTYIVLRVIIQITQAMCYIGCFIIAMEICDESQRNGVGSLFPLPWAFGCMVVPGIAYLVKPWRWQQVSYSFLSLITLLCWFLPESPRWLIFKGRHAEALSILKTAARVNKKSLPSEEVLFAAMRNIMQKEGNPVKEESGGALTSGFCHYIRTAWKYSILVFTTRGVRLRALLLYYIWVVTTAPYYSLSHFSSIINTNDYVYSFLSAAVEVPAYLGLWPAITYLGRRVTLAMLLLLTGTCVSVVTLFLILQDEVPAELKVFFSLSGKMAITASLQLVWVFTGELFSTNHRTRIVGEASMIARVGSMMVPYINDLLGRVYPWAPGAMLSVAVIIAAGLVFLLPETANRKLTQNENEEFTEPETSNLRPTQNEYEKVTEEEISLSVI
ncbi:organic cation transporter protein-like isoform X2 [Scylla paramamosain]